MNRHGVSAMFALLAFLDWNIIAKLTLLVAVINFITNPDPLARIASVVMMGVMLMIVRCIKSHLAKQAEEERAAAAGPASPAGSFEDKQS
mmetsp:Transcript_9369/g.18220  ORF Transcript_9369/g.18220 Transcript_9369/m.18220 type:complete len:90 (+) Transcript_9369:35-304(+)